MDMIKIGKYLAELRHGQGLTQEALGEKLGVTNKTVSRWENGNYLPTVDALQQLSELYGVTINEILSGQRLEEAEYKTAAEERLKETLERSAFDLQDRIRFYKVKWDKEHLVTDIFLMLVIVGLIIAGFILDNGVQYIGMIAAFAFSIYEHNGKMAYVEKRAFGETHKPTKE